MKKTSRRRPEVESLDSLMMLSTLVHGVQPSLSAIEGLAQSSQVSSTGHVQAIGQASPSTSQGTGLLGLPTSFVGSAHPVITGLASPSIGVGQAPRLSISGFASTSTTTLGQASHRPSITGFASTSTTTLGQSARRPTLVGSGSVGGGTVHAMVLPGGKPVVIGQGSNVAATTPPAVQAARLISVGHSSTGLKSS